MINRDVEIMINKEQLRGWIEEYLQGTEYELVTLKVSAANDILVEVDRLAGVDVDFCAELNRYLVGKLESGERREASGESTACSEKEIIVPLWGKEQAKSKKEQAESDERGEDYSLEVGSVSLTDPFKTKTQYLKNLGHDVEVAFSNRCAEVHTASLNEQATDASALPTNCEFAETPLTKGEKLIKYKGLLVSVDEETFSVDVEERVAVEGKKRKEKQIITHTWRYDEPKYVRYDLKF